MDLTLPYESIASGELKTKLGAGVRHELLDVGEPWEFELVHSP